MLKFKKSFLIYNIVYIIVLCIYNYIYFKNTFTTVNNYHDNCIRILTNNEYWDLMNATDWQSRIGVPSNGHYDINHYEIIHNFQLNYNNFELALVRDRVNGAYINAIAVDGAIYTVEPDLFKFVLFTYRN
jgi:hypothetical protein